MTAIVHQDEQVVVVEKPSGLVMHRGWVKNEDALLQVVRDEIGAYVYPVHRLDRGASGLVVFALDAESARSLSEAFAKGEVTKLYLALTRGHPPEHVVVDHPVPKGPKEERVPAVTEIWRRESFGRYSLVEASPRTGRFHQIRRHLKHLSCPLIGDVNYGKGEHNRIFREQHGLTRLALHATRIAFRHPLSGDALEFESVLPEDMAGAVESCRCAYSE